MVKHLVVSAIAQLVLTQSPSWCEFRNARSKSGFLVAACEKARRLGSKFCIDVAFVRLRKNMSCELPTNITNLTRKGSLDARGFGTVDPYKAAEIVFQIAWRVVKGFAVGFSRKSPSWLLVPGVPSHHCQTQERVG